MENHFYHIRWPPLNVTIFITHVPKWVMGATPMAAVMIVTLRVNMEPCLNSAYRCCLLITLANSLDPDQARQNVGPDLDLNCLTL